MLGLSVTGVQRVDQPYDTPLTTASVSVGAINGSQDPDDRPRAARSLHATRRRLLVIETAGDGARRVGVDAASSLVAADAQFEGAELASAATACVRSPPPDCGSIQLAARLRA